MLVTSVAQVVFPYQAAGSLVGPVGSPVGSTLIGQDWPSPAWFQGRPSATGGQSYNPMASGGSNLSPHGKALAERRAASATAWQARAQEAQQTSAVPEALLSASGSGLDPHLDLQAALWQVPLVAQARNLDAGELTKLVRSLASTTGWPWDPEPFVNVLGLNRALAQISTKS
jgi:K+-transporting ATPase ATPase C chain